MTSKVVADVVLNGTDSAEVKILEVYSKNPPRYAIYRTADRVLIQFADDINRAQLQRRAMSVLSPVRGDINGLIGSWRGSKARDEISKVDLLDRATANALIVALEGDVAGATILLNAVKQKIIDDRTSWARSLYLMISAGMSAFCMLIVCSVLSPWFVPIHAFSSDARSLWLAAGAGTAGAFFSIATGLRRRTVLPDLQWGDNTTDAILRVTIGIIAAVLLLCLLKSQLVVINIGSLSSAAGSGSPGGEYNWILVLVLGFIGGFSERLVPDLLDKATSAAEPTTRAAPASDADKAGAARAVAGADRADGKILTATGVDADPEATDACLCDSPFNLDDATGDHALPAATGGVAP